MTKTQTIISDLKKAKSIYENNPTIDLGICSILMYPETKQYLQIHRPSVLSKFWWNISYNRIIKNANNKYWWKLNMKGNIQRIKFLEYLIKTMEKSII